MLEEKVGEYGIGKVEGKSLAREAAGDEVVEAGAMLGVARASHWHRLELQLRHPPDNVSVPRRQPMTVP